MHSRDREDQGAGELNAVLKQDANNATAQRGLGYASLYKKQYEQAAQYFARAAALNSNDPWVHYYVALLRERSGVKAGPEAENVEKELKAAIALNPQFADAYNLLGVAEMRNGQLPDAMQHLSEAIRMSPRNEMYVANLALAYLNARNWDQASGILERLKGSDDPEIAAMAKENLAHLAQVRNAERAGMLQTHPVASAAPQAVAARSTPASAPVAATPAPADESGPILFLKGTLRAIDCSTGSAATLTIEQGGKTWKMATTDYKHLIVIGADQFSCSWSGRKVAVNYRQTQPGQGMLVSLELE